MSFIERPQRAPMMPNDSVVEGKVWNIQAPTDTEPMESWNVRIKQSQDVEGEVNFTKNLVGKSEIVYVWSDVSPDVKEDMSFRGHMKVSGDERGTRIVLHREMPPKPKR